LIVGIIIPAVVLLGLSLIYIVRGGQIQISFSAETFFPDFTNFATLPVFVAFILSYGGIESSASYVSELENPSKQYPRTIILVVVSAVILNTIGGLSIAMTIPLKELSMSGGIMQALIFLFHSISPSLAFMGKIVAGLIAIGVLGEISSWVIGPSKGLYFAAHKGFLPKLFRKQNKNSVPVNILIFQGIIVTIWAFVLTFLSGSSNLSFTAAISMTVSVYLLTYILLFISYIVLKTKKGLESSFEIKGGKAVGIIIAIIGLVFSFLCLFISFFPQIATTGSQLHSYLILTISGFIISAVLPFIIYIFRDKDRCSVKQEHLRYLVSSEINKFVKPRGRSGYKI
jgi:amino acid transporter